MRRTTIYALLILMLVAAPALAADYKISGKFTGGYSYANETGEDELGLELVLDFKEAGLLTAHAALSLVGDIGIDDGWWVKYTTIPLNVLISDNSENGNKWAPIETVFSMLSSGTSSNRFAKVWGDPAPSMSYKGQASMDEATGYYSVAAQAAWTLPTGLTLTSSLGWLRNEDGYALGLVGMLSGAIPVIGGTFKVAAGNFADLDTGLIPPVNFWNADDAQAFAAYAGVLNIDLGKLSLSEISYKMSMPGVYDGLFSSTNFYVKDLQEVYANVMAKLDPVTIVFKNGLWFQSFNSSGGNNANLDVLARLGNLSLGINLDSKLNWVSGLKHGEEVELRASYKCGEGNIGGTLGYNSNWDGVGKYEVKPSSYGSDQVYATLTYDSSFGLALEAYGDYEQFGTNLATAGIYAEYEKAFDSIPLVEDLKALIAGRFDYTWEEPGINDYSVVGMFKLDTKVDAKWGGGLLFITRNASSPELSFEPIASLYSKYVASSMVTVQGTVTYRHTPGMTVENNVYAQLKGDIVVSKNTTASVYWGSSGLKSVTSGDADYDRPWGAYFAEVDPMYWDTFGANFSISF